MSMSLELIQTLQLFAGGKDRTPLRHAPLLEYFNQRNEEMKK
jgi:hypothetical protein